MTHYSPAPELAHLQTFLTVCRAKTIGQAARQLRISQPAVSAHLKALEARMGRKLLIRSPRGVEPTPAGLILRGKIEAHLDGLAALTAADQDSKGLVVLGGPPDLLSIKVLPALAQLYQSGMQVKVKPGIVESLLELLVADELDLVIATRQPPGRTEVHFEPLFDEEYVLVGNRQWYDRVAGHSAEAIVAALQTATFLAFDEQLPLIRDYPLIRHHYADIFGGRTHDQAGLYISDLRALRDAAIAGAGVTVLPSYLAAEALAANQLFELFSPPTPYLNTLYIATRQGPLHPRVQQIITTLKVVAPSWERIQRL